MRHFSILIAIVALMGGAQAADMPPAGAVARPSPVTNWSGFYIGAVGGYAADSSNSGPTAIKGPFAGGTLGYNFQSGIAVFGIEADAAWSNVQATAALPPFLSATDRVIATGTVRGRAGVAFDTVFLYGTAGYAWADNRFSVTALGITLTDTQIHNGWTAGGGVELMFAPGWSLKAEYLYRSFASQNYFVGLAPPGIPSGTFKANSGQLGVNFHF